jgi:hypothetical protein
MILCSSQTVIVNFPSFLAYTLIIQSPKAICQVIFIVGVVSTLISDLLLVKFISDLWNVASSWMLGCTAPVVAYTLFLYASYRSILNMPYSFIGNVLPLSQFHKQSGSDTFPAKQIFWNQILESSDCASFVIKKNSLTKVVKEHI